MMIDFHMFSSIVVNQIMSNTYFDWKLHKDLL